MDQGLQTRMPCVSCRASRAQINLASEMNPLPKDRMAEGYFLPPALLDHGGQSSGACKKKLPGRPSSQVLQLNRPGTTGIPV